MRLSRSDAKMLAERLAAEQLNHLCEDLRDALRVEFGLTDTGARAIIHGAALNAGFEQKQRGRFSA